MEILTATIWNHWTPEAVGSLLVRAGLAMVVTVGGLVCLYQFLKALEKKWTK